MSPDSPLRDCQWRWGRLVGTSSNLGPDVTYWFSPFITRKGLESELSSFLDDVKSEQPQSISHSLQNPPLRALTISARADPAADSVLPAMDRRS